MEIVCSIFFVSFRCHVCLHLTFLGSYLFDLYTWFTYLITRCLLPNLKLISCEVRDNCQRFKNLFQLNVISFTEFDFWFSILDNLWRIYWRCSQRRRIPTDSLNTYNEDFILYFAPRDSIYCSLKQRKQEKTQSLGNFLKLD